MAPALTGSHPEIAESTAPPTPQGALSDGKRSAGLRKTASERRNRFKKFRMLGSGTHLVRSQGPGFRDQDSGSRLEDPASGSAGYLSGPPKPEP